MIQSRMQALLRSLRKSSPLGGLESRSSFAGCSSSLQPVWFSTVENHSQVISPGRSGTRWLANVMLEITQAFVCHASPKTLSEVGYLFDRSLISEEEALGAYRFSRSDYLSCASMKQKAFVDLDCKNSPLTQVVARAYPNCKFIVILRNPVSFIKSGIARDYFLSKNPQAWGHLEPSTLDGVASLAAEDVQIFKIASFWRRIARLSQQCRDENPSRVFIVDSSAMFRDEKVVSSLLKWLAIDHQEVARSGAWSKIANSNKKRVALSSNQVKLLESELLYDFCVDGLDSEFIATTGSLRVG